MGTIKIGDKKAFLLEPDKIQPVIYSTEEREIGVWTDGKPLYEKTFLFDYNDLQNETYGKYINLSIPNIDKSCLFTISIEDGQLILPYYQGANLYIIAFPVLSTDVCKFSFRYGSEVSSQISSFFTNCKIILRYTKSTDTAGSGKWTPQGVPAHHYSTDEQVIGTWIDGSTLYEKTWTNLDINVAYNTWTNVIEVASDVDILVDIEALASTVEKHNISGSGIEYYLNKNDHYIKAEYNQNANRRNIGTLTVRYTKSS